MVYKTTLLRYQPAYIKEVKNILDIYQITIFQCSKYSNLPTYWLVWSVYKTSTNGGHRTPWQLFRGHNSLANHLWPPPPPPPPPPYCIWGLFVTRKLYFIYNISIYKQTRFIHFWPPPPPPWINAGSAQWYGLLCSLRVGGILCSLRVGGIQDGFHKHEILGILPQGPTGHDKICEKNVIT